MLFPSAVRSPLPSRPRSVGSRVAVAGVLAVVLAACGGPDTTATSQVPDDVGPPTDDPTVAVVDNEFEPAETVVAAGTTVTWSFEGEAAHDVSGDGFESETLTEGEFTHAFDEPGTYAYVCTLHNGMDGVVYVTE